jgi:hypothetical protein
VRVHLRKRLSSWRRTHEDASNSLLRTCRKSNPGISRSVTRLLSLWKTVSRPVLSRISMEMSTPMAKSGPYWTPRKNATLRKSASVASSFRRIEVTVISHNTSRKRIQFR